MLTVALKPTPVAQVDFCGRNLKSTSTVAILSLLQRKNYLFSLFFRSIFPSRSPFCFLHLRSTPRGTNSTIVVASKVMSTWKSQIDF
jgi:hypothetical protein